MVRLQLSLFVPPPIAAELEAVRRLLDPVQAGLIPAHVTLCRDEEAEGLDLAQLGARLQAAAQRALTLRFGAPEAFQGHGVLLPCVGGEDAFQALRRQVLGTEASRRQAPHITLAHPRNPRAPGNSPAHAAPLASGLAIAFDQVQVIRQQDGGPWRILAQHPL